MLASATAATDDSASGPDSGRIADTLIGPDGMLEHWLPDAPPPPPPPPAALLELPPLEHAATARITAAAIPASSDTRRTPRRRESGMYCIRSLLASKTVPGTRPAQGMINSRASGRSARRRPACARNRKLLTLV